MAFQEKLCRALNCDELSSHGIVQIVYSGTFHSTYLTRRHERRLVGSSVGVVVSRHLRFHFTF